MEFLKKYNFVVVACILAAVGTVILDCIAVFFQLRLTPIAFVAVWAGMAAALSFIKLTWKKLLPILAVLTGAIVLVAALGYYFAVSCYSKS